MQIIDYSTFKQKRGISRINEDWSSNILRTIINPADKNAAARGWGKSFIKDFYKKFNISIDKIQDEDIVEISPDAFLDKDPYNKTQNADRYLAIFVNDDPSLKQDAKDGIQDLSKKLHALESERDASTGKIKATVGEIELVKSQIDMLKALDVPFLTAIAMGRRFVYYGFVNELNAATTPSDELPPATKSHGMVFKTAHQVLRYGVHPAPWIMMRYFGLTDEDNATIKSTGENVAKRSTKCYVVDIYALQQKYGMGDKLDARAAYKVDNPAFKSMDDIKADNQKRYMMKLTVVNPHIVLRKFKSIAEAYMKYYAKRVLTLASPKDLTEFIGIDSKLIDTEAKGQKNIIGLSHVFLEFDKMFNDYFELYKSYINFLKENGQYEKEVMDDPQRYMLNQDRKDSSTIDTQQKIFNNKLRNYLDEFRKLREMGEEVYATLNKVGIIEPLKREI